MSKKKEVKGHTVVQDSTYQHMYRIRYPDGKIGDELYSKPWAEENCWRLNNPQKEGLDIDET